MPRHSTTWATSAEEQGKFDEAARQFRQALALKPDFAEAHFHLADLKTFRPGDADLAALEALAADSDRLPPGKMLYVHFALGKALEDVGDYPRAFEHWLQGNALKRREVHYNEAACQRTFQAIADVFDASLLDRFDGAGDPSPVPIFIVGMPRSGSTLVEQILASHPQVHAAGELTNLDRVVKTVSDSERPAASVSCLRRRHSTPTACGDWARLIWQACRRCPTARRGSPTRCQATFSMSA